LSTPPDSPLTTVWIGPAEPSERTGIFTIVPWSVLLTQTSLILDSPFASAECGGALVTTRTPERIERTVCPIVPARVDYRLTAMGRGLADTIFRVADWSRDHKAAIAAARNRWDTEHSGSAPATP
jgi:hypothetical protein